MLVWLISTANAITEADRLPRFPFTGFPTNKPTAGELKDMCRVIAGSKEPVSQDSFLRGRRLLGQDILQRTAVNNYYRLITKPDNDPKIHEKNRSHRAYIDVLRQCFGILQGPGLGETSSMEHEAPVDDLEILSVLENQVDLFPAKEGDGEKPESGSEEPEMPEKPEAPEEPEEPEEPESPEKPPRAAKRKKQKLKGKLKRKAGGQCGKNEGSSSSKKSGQDADDTRAKDFGTLVANFSCVWSTARALLQKEWLKFACNEANSVAVTAWCNTAVKLVEDSWTDLLKDFPDHDAHSFESLMGSITAGRKSAKGDQVFNVNLITFDQAFLGIHAPDTPSVVDEY
ncbi:hypothetical protein V8F33_005842 [Rhypophila sp. PSN 637]